MMDSAAIMARYGALLMMVEAAGPEGLKYCGFILTRPSNVIDLAAARTARRVRHESTEEEAGKCLT
jgi:hypothetical protein